MVTDYLLAALLILCSTTMEDPLVNDLFFAKHLSL